MSYPSQSAAPFWLPSNSAAQRRFSLGAQRAYAQRAWPRTLGLMRDTRAMIRAAFKSVKKPSAVRDITPHACIECDEIATELMPYTFDCLPRTIIEANSQALPLLSPEALHHYLPAYLLHGLDNPKSDAMMFAVFHLAPSQKNLAENKAYFDARFEVFDDAQRLAIAAFFEDVRDYQYYVPHEDEFERAGALWPMRPNNALDRARA